MNKKLIYGLVLLLFSCNKIEKKQILSTKKDESILVENKYSNLFRIINHTDYKEIIIPNPWEEGENFAKYILIPKGIEIPKNIPNKSVIIRTPVNRIVPLSSPSIGLYDKLDALNKIVGIGKEIYIYNKIIIEKLKEGTVKAVGSDRELNIESLVDLNPEMVTASGFQTRLHSMELVSQAGIKVIYNIGWMEKSPLARAEWIKFAAVFIGKEKEADIIFDKIVSQYESISKLAKKVSYKPKILLGKKWKGTWNTSGGNSYFAEFLRDAGADYYWFKDTSSGSLPLSFEEIADKQMDTDIWINPGRIKSIAELLAEDKRYLFFNPVKTKQIYNYYNRVSESGANAYWEEGYVNPHLILFDLIKIFHPKLLPDYELYFYKKLE